MNENTFRDAITKPGVSLRRKFLYGNDDYTDKLDTNGISMIRRDVNLATGKATIKLNNTGGWWNFLHATNTALGAVAQIQVYMADDDTNVLTLLKGKVQRVSYPGTTAVLTVRDHAGDWLDTKVGSNLSPMQRYTSASQFPDYMAFNLLSTEGGLDDTPNPSNTDIDYTSFAAWRDQTIRPAGYLFKAKFSGETIATILRKLCQMTHSYIWVNNDGKVAFAPPYEPGYSYEEENSEGGRPVLINRDKLLNDVTVRHGYTWSGGEWVSSVTDTDATSITAFGTFPITIEDRIMVHNVQASAEKDRDDTLANYAYPLRHFSINAGPPGIMEDVCNQITVTDELKGITAATAIIEEINYSLTPNDFGVKLKARWPW